MRTNLTQQMKDILDDYSDEVMEVVTETIQEVGKDAADEFSYIGDFQNRTGRYRRSWDVTVEKLRTFTTVIVHAKAPSYRLTHLLENGHRKVNGSGMTTAYPHISIVNDKAQDEAIKRIMQKIQSIR